MRNVIIALLSFFLFSSVCAHAQTDETAFDNIQWQEGPSIAKLDNLAQIRLPQGFVFADSNDTRILMESMQNPTSGSETGFVAPQTLDWFILFEFNDTGYVRDDEKDSLDPEAILKSIKESTERSNKERKKRGWPIITILGWEQEPNYNKVTNNLEWAIRGESEGSLIVNFNTRLLGRSGVMKVTLVTSPESLSYVLPDFKTVLAGFEYQKGRKYAEYRQGDKLAKYGLSALVVGGAAAVAAKSGLFKYIWKILAVVGIAVVGFIRSIFGGKKQE
ncbi:DUF2167 domain-containing protein [Thermodesulfobacteriota bacterium]